MGVLVKWRFGCFVISLQHLLIYLDANSKERWAYSANTKIEQCDGIFMLPLISIYAV